MINILILNFFAKLKNINVQEKLNPYQLLAVFLGIVFLTLSSYIQVPVLAVPINMQTFAVTLIGAMYGWRLAGITIAAWLLNGALGMPVLAGGACGLHHILGLTGGYLLSFPLIGMLTGWLINRYWNGSSIFLPFLIILVSNTCCLLLGAAWLAIYIGAEQAMKVGILPFILGEIMKAALATVTLRIWVQSKTK